MTSRDGADSLNRLPRRWLLAGDEVHDVEALEQALDQELQDVSLCERSKRADVEGRALGIAIDFDDILRVVVVVVCVYQRASKSETRQGGAEAF